MGENSVFMQLTGIHCYNSNGNPGCTVKMPVDKFPQAFFVEASNFLPVYCKRKPNISRRDWACF